MRRGAGVAAALWIRASARRKWKASMRLDGDAEEPDAGPGAPVLLGTARRLGLGFGGG